MTTPDFYQLYEGLCNALGRRPNGGQSDIWFQLCRDRGYSLPVVARAIDNLIATSNRFPVPKDLISACSKIQAQISENERIKEKEVEDGPFRAKLVDGTPVSRIAATMVKALKHEELDEAEQAKLKEMGWK